MPAIKIIRWFTPILILAPAARCLAGDDAGPLVRSLRLVQRFGKSEAVAPENDQKLKGTLFKALGKEGTLNATGVRGIMDPATFARLAGTDGKLDASEVREALDADMPESRKRLDPKVAAHADLLTTSFDMIDETHVQAGRSLVDWIAAN
jgi:arsenate reductase